MRTLALVDVQNQFLAAKDIGKYIDFKKVKSHIEANGSLFMIKAYLVRSPESPVSKFENLLRSSGYKLDVKKAELSFRRDGSRHFSNTDQDMSICVDCMANVGNFDKLILMSGDGDFIDLIKHLKSLGKTVEIWTVKGKSFNKKLCDYVDTVNFLTEDFFYENRRRKEDIK